MLFYNLIPKGAHAPFGNPHFKGTLSVSAMRCQLSHRESQVSPARGCFYGEPLVSPTRWEGFIRPTPWSPLPRRSVRGRAPLALAHPLPCTYLVKEDSRPAWEGGDNYIV